MRILEKWARDFPQQFQGKKNIEMLIKAFARQLQEIRDVFDDLDTKLDIDTAVGQNLDYVGTIIPLSRKEAGELDGYDASEPVISDERYRQLLRYKNLADTNDCTYYTLMEGLSLLWGDIPIYYSEDPARPAAIILDTREMEGTVDTRPFFRTPLIRSAGVTLWLYVRTRTEMETARAQIASGLGFAVTETNLPELEREIDYGTALTVKTGHATISQDMLPAVERDYKMNAEVHAGQSGLYSITVARLPPVGRDS